MRSSHVRGRALATALLAFGVGLAVAHTASADPNDGAQPPAPFAPPPAPADVAAPAPVTGTAPAVTACKQFARAWRVSSVYYNEFAHSIAGGGDNPVEYEDPTVSGDNVAGRAALRKAAAEALSASATPSLQPEIAAPMRSWSLDATKLLLKMGLRGSRDTLNKTATELNNDATKAQLACAQAGVRR